MLFLRHKLQKGLLTRDQEPKPEEMKVMSEFLTKLEAFPDLEVSIIRATKINKVLKAILKLENIPKEEEFKFKPRSQTLLDKWNKLLASEQQAASASAPAADKEATTNGVNGKAKEGEKETPKEDASKTNGAKGKSEEPSTSDKAEEAPKDKDGDSKMEEADAKAEEKKDVEEKTEKPEAEEVCCNSP